MFTNVKEPDSIVIVATLLILSQTRAPNGRRHNHNGRSSGGGHSAGNEDGEKRGSEF